MDKTDLVVKNFSKVFLVGLFVPTIIASVVVYYAEPIKNLMLSIF